MQDADEAVGELAQGGVVVCAVSAVAVVVSAGAGRAVQGAEAWLMRASRSRSLWTNRAAMIFFLPEARVTGLVPV